jgi:hypothetical protein
MKEAVARLIESGVRFQEVHLNQGGRPLPLDEAGPVHLVHDHVADRTVVAESLDGAVPRVG